MDNQTNSDQNMSQDQPQPQSSNQSSNNQSAPQAEAYSPRQHRMLMGVLSYLGPLVIIPLVTSKQDPFVKFHVKQGLVLLSIEIIVWILASILWQLWVVYRLINLATVILSIIGIVNVSQNKEKELPLIGHLSKFFPI
ncbi:MAG TPA: DUF4870 domain-containing protein [Candidatus Paceibacterota bacterium]|jgi:uncharacterized membrane protein|nr:DUF4870 domain-containing protein [Candidatus Paceibacterota bacterium]